LRLKDKYFIFGVASGIIFPLVEYGLTNNTLNITSKFTQAFILGGELWHFIFLYLVVFNSLLIYVKKLRDRINPNSKIAFVVSGVAFGFSIISIISGTVEFLKL